MTQIQNAELLELEADPVVNMVGVDGVVGHVEQPQLVEEAGPNVYLLEAVVGEVKSAEVVCPGPG